VNKVRQYNDKNPTIGVPASEKDFLFISVQKKKIKVLLSDILFIESQREYIRFVTTNTEYLTKMSTAEIESRLPASQFLRVHRSFIVAISKIDSFTAEEAEIMGHIIPIGRSYRDNLSKLLS
jgi:DNA-binding LytR/AlgR family response regulator